MAGTTSGQNVTYTLPSEFANYIIVRSNATVTVNNFLISASSSKYVSLWIVGRQTLYLEQSITSSTNYMSVAVDLYYLKP